MPSVLPSSEDTRNSVWLAYITVTIVNTLHYEQGLLWLYCSKPVNTWKSGEGNWPEAKRAVINRKVLPLYHQYPPAMALPMLVGGSECGPSNPLQGLSKRFDQDRGLQQVRISSSIRPTSHLRRTPLGPLRRSSSRLLERCMSSFHETFLCLYLSI